MRNQKNKGLFPFYEKLEHQASNLTGCGSCPYGYITPLGEFPPFQLEYDDNLDTQATWVLIPCSRNDQSINLPSSLLTKTCLSNGKTIISYQGGNHSVDGIECGYYYIKLTFGNIECFSEFLKITDTSIQENVYSISVGNTGNIAGWYYQITAFQRIWIQAFVSTPEIIVTEEVKTDGFGKELVKFSRTQEICNIVVPNIPDVLLKNLTTIRNHDNILLINNEGDIQKIENYQFSSQVQGDCFNIGTIRFDSCVDVYSGCEEDETVIPCIEN